ncbi:hypothetical protein MTR67_030997 [Solanum verrucosum]|uniref:Uncharacterized protein n=1 Tax=Solanum verrucosum TaxID=315347 RepID=A0AAF0U1L7_SOLVR|nr:hypothetical protein MTR67_030997 [Solanum verrucosum]
MKLKYSLGMEANHLVDMASRPPLYGVGLYNTEFHSLLSLSMSVNVYSHYVRCALWTYEILLSLMYEYCVKVRRMNGKFTFVGLNVELSVDGGMGCYSYIAHCIAWGWLR